MFLVLGHFGLLINKRKICINECVHLDDIELDDNLDDIERLEIEKNALFPNTDEVSVCSCRGACLKEHGRNVYPCKSMGNYCSEACHGDSNAEYQNQHAYV